MSTVCFNVICGRPTSMFLFSEKEPQPKHKTLVLDVHHQHTFTLLTHHPMVHREIYCIICCGGLILL